MTQKVTLTLDSADAAGNLFTRGSVRIFPSARIPDEADQLLLEAAPARVSFPRSGGPPTVDLYPNNLIGPQQDDGTPGWTYTIYYDGCPGNPQQWSFYLLSTSGYTQRLSGLAAVPAAQPGQVSVPLPPGAPPAAGQVWIADGGGYSGHWGDQSGGGAPAAAYVRFTTSGAAFSPKVALTSGSTATVSWTVEEGWPAASGLNPSLSFGIAATRHVRMYVTDNGSSALGQVSVINLGFDHALDQGNYSPSSSYDYASQQVTAVDGLTACSALTMLLATQTPLAGLVDLTGLSMLTNVELYGSDVQAVNVTGCTAMERLVVEQDAVTAVDLGPVAGSLYEFRAAAQQGGALSPAPLPVNLARAYHFCVRDQAVTLPALSRLPVVQELWIWNTGQSGALAPVSTALTNVQAYSNAYTSATFPAGAFSGNDTYLDLHSNQLASVTLPTANGLAFVDLHDNLLDAAGVNAVLENLAANSISNGTVNVGGTGNAAPAGAGLAAVTTLQGRGWTVTVAGGGGGGGGGGFTHRDAGYNSAGSGLSLSVTLSGAVAAGDLLVAYVQSGGGTPSVTDTAGNTWASTASGQYHYCLSAAAAPGGVTITAAVGSGYVHQVIADRFTPPGSVSFGAAAETGSSGTIGLNYNGTGCGDLGTVPAHALAHGAFSADDASADQAYTPGFQTGTTAPADAIGSQFNGAHGTGLSLYVLDCANEDATLTWYGTGTGAIGHAASAYFTSP